MRKNRIAIFATALGVCVLTSVLYLGGFLDSWQEYLFDRFQPVVHANPHVLVIAIDDASLHEYGQWPWRRAVYGKVLSHLSHAAAIGIDVNFSEPSRFGIEDDQTLAAMLVSRKGQRIVLPLELDAHDAVLSRPLSPYATSTVPGFVNVDGAGQLLIRKSFYSRGAFSSFASLLADQEQAGEHAHGASSYRVPYTEEGFPVLSFRDVENGLVPDALFEDAYVLIGATAGDLHDYFLTPVGELPGVVLQATALNSLLIHSRFVELPRWCGVLLLLSIITLIFGIGYRVHRLTLRLAAFSLLAIVSFGSSIYAFRELFVLPVLYMLIAICVAAAATIVLQYVTEAKEKRFIRNSFQHYLTPDVIDGLLRNPERLRLGGEKRDMTILFSDIRGFTSFSEQMSATELTDFLNVYLTEMTDIVMRHRGVVDKYIGDAIMAFWGAPLENPLHVYDACTTARAMLEALAEFNARQKSGGGRVISIGIGINTGEVVVGNMGSSQRFNYTVMGDGVNLSSRLEGLNKYYGTACLVSGAVVAALDALGKRSEFRFRRVDIVRVKGKTRPTDVFELLPRQATGGMSDALLEVFERGSAQYFEGRLREAEALLRTVERECPDDVPTQNLLRRIEGWDTTTQPFDPVYEHKEK